MKQKQIEKMMKIKYRKKLMESHSYFQAITENKLLCEIQEMVDEYINNLSDEELANDYNYLVENRND